jgi:SpoVK/Ycf46/Vps4 family AAA+-type ATPase
MVAKAIAHESGTTFFSISSSALTSKWLGEGEKMVKTLFLVAYSRAPSIVFVDEVDSLLTQRKADEDDAMRRIKTEFLVQFDGLSNERKGHVLVIGATNLPQELDNAARRRFPKRLYLPLPNQPARETLLRTLLAKNNHSLTPDDFENLSRDTDGYSGADLKALCTDAAMGPMRSLRPEDMMSISASNVPPISYEHFCQSLRSTSPSVGQGDLQVYVEWNNTYGTKPVQ